MSALVDAGGSVPGLLAGYAPELLAQVLPLLAAGRVPELLARRYPQAHAVRSDVALYEYVNGLKRRHLRHAPPLAKAVYCDRLRQVQEALGTHTAVSRVQGGRLKAKREIRIASVFKQAPAAFLQMIVVHELAHLREPAHDKAFYALCSHMAPDYHQLEFDLRLWLAARDSAL